MSDDDNDFDLETIGSLVEMLSELPPFWALVSLLVLVVIAVSFCGCAA